jgi:hypothetical protein
MSAIVIWRPEPLTARLIAAARPAAMQFSALARARAPSKRVASSIRVLGTATTFTVGSAHPLAAFFEKGVGPHEIEPKGRVLRLADGRFVTGPVKHPGMRAKPFLRPLLPLWASLYRRSAASAFRGF